MAGLEKLGPKDPSQIGQYKIVARLGSGGMGVVFLGTVGVKRVAIKIVRSSFLDSPTLRTRFEREIETLKKIDSPRVAKFLDSGIEEDMAWHAVEFVNGPTLSELVNEEGPLSQDEWWKLASELSEVLKTIHALGIVHRDIKPSNIIMTEKGLSLIDFGISQDTDATSLTSTGMVAGSPAWLAPEQLEGVAISPATDLFSAGSVLVFAAKGVSPWGSETSMTIPVLYQKILTASPDLSGLDSEQAHFVTALLQNDPKLRKVPQLPSVIPSATRESVTPSQPKTQNQRARKSGEGSQVKEARRSRLPIGLPMFLVITLSLGVLAFFISVNSTFISWPTASQVSPGPSLESSATQVLSQPCSKLSSEVGKLNSAAQKASREVRFSSWREVSGQVVDALAQYKKYLSNVPKDDLPMRFVSKNLTLVQELDSRMKSMDPNTSFSYIIEEPAYISWREHATKVFQAGKGCG